jgi:hypothetical protein
MNEQQLAAVKQALGALKKGTGWMEHGEIIAALHSIISQDALDKMAEESRTSGLRLDDWDKIGCVNHDCDKCKAVQEPWGYLEIDDIESQREYPHNCRNVNLWHEGGEGMTAIYIAPPAPQPVPVKTYHDGKPWPVQPKPWVGLTKEDKEDFWTADQMTNEEWEHLFAKIETRLKEKNT